MITKHPLTEDFACIPNRLLQDSALGWAARGLGAYLLSLPGTWHISTADLVNRGDLASKDAIRALFKELVAAGYLTSIIERDETGKITKVDYCMCNRPGTALPGLVEPGLVKSSLLNKQGIKKTKTPLPPKGEQLGLDGLVAPPPPPDASRAERLKTAADIRRIIDENLNALLASWGTHFPNKPQPSGLRGARRRLLTERWNDGIKRGFYATAEEGLHWWDNLFSWCAESKTMKEKQFFNFDFLLKAENFDKTIDGNYRD